MTNQTLKKWTNGISFFLMILPFIYIVYLSILPKETNETIVEVLKANPILNINLIILFLLFFYGVIMFQYTKQYFDNLSIWVPGMSYLLIILLLVFLGARYYPLLIIVMLACYYLITINKLKIGDLLKFATLKQNWSQYHQGATVILCLIFMIQILVMTRLN